MLWDPIPDSVDLPRSIAPASLENHARVLETLEQRQAAVMWAIYDALDDGCEDVTGGELAQRMGWTVLQTRPRLTELHDLKLVTRSPSTRPSKVPGEARCHAYAPSVPRAAFERSRMR
jgi:hypothetical protein